jgi:hypothetical protein
MNLSNNDPSQEGAVSWHSLRTFYMVDYACQCTKYEFLPLPFCALQSQCHLPHPPKIFNQRLLQVLMYERLLPITFQQ